MSIPHPFLVLAYSDFRVKIHIILGLLFDFNHHTFMSVYDLDLGRRNAEACFSTNGNSLGESVKASPRKSQDY